MGTHLPELVQHNVVCGNDLIPILNAEFCKLRVLCFLRDVGVADRDNGVFPVDFIILIGPVSSISVDLVL